jgi:hypothetical protein
MNTDEHGWDWVAWPLGAGSNDRLRERDSGSIDASLDVAVSDAAV